MFTNPKYINNLSGNAIGVQIVNGTDVTFVPIDEANTDYQELMRLVNAGEVTIAPADPIVIENPNS